MKRMPTWRMVMVAVACGGMLIGGLPLNAAPPVAVRSPAPTPVLDVALSAGGTLIGHVLDAQGRPQAGVQVVFSSLQVLRALQADLAPLECPLDAFSTIHHKLYQNF